MSVGSNPSTSSKFPSNNANVLAVRRITEELFNFDGWRIRVTKSPILPSTCYCSRGSHTVGKNASSTTTAASPNPLDLRSSTPGVLCQVCTFAAELSLTHLPEMVFPDNVLELLYEPSGFTLNFRALDAMKLINTTSSPVHVAYSEEWKAVKAEEGLPVSEALQAYDWTYSTDYKGSLRIDRPGEEAEPLIEVTSSSGLNVEKLKQREPILFFEEMTLYEDELHDNGISNLTIKMRVMPSGFFILLRFFLRVDQVMVRISDTRIHYETGNTFLIRQFQTREQVTQALAHLEPNILTDPNVLYAHLPVTREVNERISISLDGSAPA